MQPDIPMLPTYRMLVARMRDHVSSALDRASGDRDDTIRQAARQWGRIDKQLNLIDDEVVTFGEHVFTTITDSDLTPEARSRRIEARALVTRATIATARTDILSRVDSTLTRLRESSFPARKSTDPIQEIALAGVKADLRMTLDVCQTEQEVFDRLSRQLERAVADGDDLATWLLVSSHWPTDYLESRGALLFTEAWPAEIDRILDATATGQRGEYRRLYQVLANPRTGLGSLTTILGAALGTVLDQAQTWALTVPADSADVSPFGVS